ncbi:sensor histidine kinase [Fodinicola acaciae]|uniref:sensor histidine kinase n=1 Tax=Fodinicola acaciae TaxID=2681555 RepID=UPI0013D20969|nr:sensor histidine kinase [Fodinicola acaciae]
MQTGGPSRTTLAVAAVIWLLPAFYPLFQLARHPPQDHRWIPALVACWIVAIGSYAIGAAKAVGSGGHQEARLALTLATAVALLLPFVGGSPWFGGTIWLAALAGFALPSATALVCTVAALAAGAVTAIALRINAVESMFTLTLTAAAGITVILAVRSVELGHELETARRRSRDQRAASEIQEIVAMQAEFAAAELRKAEGKHVKLALAAVEGIQRALNGELSDAGGLDLRTWVSAWGHSHRVEVEMIIDELDEPTMQTLFPVAIEALANVAQHASAHLVTVMLRGGIGTATLTVADDGAGFDPAVVPPRGGLRTMTQRLLAAGGVLTVHSAPGQGTAITAEIPLRG